MQGRRKSCVSGRPDRLRTRTYTSLTLPNLTSVAGSTPAWLSLGCHAVVKFSRVLLSIFYHAHDLQICYPVFQKRVYALRGLPRRAQ